MIRSRLPYDLWFYDDWERDLGGHPLEIGGAWMLLLRHTWSSRPVGVARKSLNEWSRILGLSNEHTLRILCYLKDAGIATIPEDPHEVLKRVNLNLTEPNKAVNANITVISRRQLRRGKSLENNRIRQQRWYRKQHPNAHLTSDLTRKNQKLESPPLPSTSPPTQPIPPSSYDSKESKDLRKDNLSFIRNKARTCYANISGGCGATWRNYEFVESEACHWCEKFRDLRTGEKPKRRKK